MKSAEIVSVGTELLLGQILDTHAPSMARILAECGIGCKLRSTVGDNFERICDTFRTALERADILITIGGLGPTADDLTRDAIAHVLGDPLIEEADYAAKLREFFTSRGLKFVESNLRQALRPESGEFIDNPFGTAPGLLCRKNGKVVIAMPGPKGEFDPMANGPVRSFLEQLSGGEVIHSRTLRICGLGESFVEAQLGELIDQANPTVAPYAHTGEVHLRVTARAASLEDAEKLIEPTDQAIRAILGDAVFGINDTSLEAATLSLMQAKGMTLATSESMTGGSLGARLTHVPGASKVYLGGLIAYSKAAKVMQLGVPGSLVEEFSPVSAEVAKSMAERTLEVFASKIAVAITGNAGPTADNGNKPVGLVYIAIASAAGTEVFESHFRGTREDIRRRAEQNALVALRKAALHWV